MPRITANNSGPQPSRHPQQDRINLLLEAAGERGLTPGELLNAAPDIFYTVGNASSLMADMYFARRAARSKRRVSCTVGTSSYRYWHLKHTPRECLPNIPRRTDVAVALSSNVSHIRAAAKPVALVPGPLRVNVRVQQSIVVNIHGEDKVLTDQEARALLNSLLTVYPDARTI